MLKRVALLWFAVLFVQRSCKTAALSVDRHTRRLDWLLWALHGVAATARQLPKRLKHAVASSGGAGGSLKALAAITVGSQDNHWSRRYHQARAGTSQVKTQPRR